MTTKEQYVKETGDIAPSGQLAFDGWYQRYVAWLENKVVMKTTEPKITICPTLAAFLKKKRVYSKFMKNVNDPDVNVEHPKHTGQPQNLRYIGVAFTWSKTPQGGIYWARLHREFTKNL